MSQTFERGREREQEQGLERRSFGEEEKSIDSRGWSKIEAKARIVLN